MFCAGEKMGEDLAKHMENLAKGVTTITESVKNVDAKLEDVKRENAELKEKLEAKGDVEDDELEDLLNDPKEQRARMKSELKTELKNELTTEGQLKAEQEKWDDKAYTEFPELNDQSSRFYIETKKEMTTLFPIGYDKMRKPIYAPDAVYNAAVRVRVRGQKEGWIPLIIERNEDFETEGEFHRRKIKGREVSEIQKGLCKLWGIDEKKVEARIKRH